MGYSQELNRAMLWLAEQPSTIFVGQGVAYPGSAMSDTFAGIDPSRLLEFPVAEDLQVGFCTGLALSGYLPVCIFPRWNFLLCGFNQLVNHLDRLPIYSDRGYVPRVIIRTCAPATEPFDTGPQHVDDFTHAVRSMLKTINVGWLRSADDVMPSYQNASRRVGSTILVERGALYDAVPSRDERGR